MESLTLDRFFSDLDSQLRDTRMRDIETIKNFFAKLNPKLNAARTLDRELNRHLAHHFNVFDYLKTDERGLSRVIADLLNPKGTHGQGSLFLNILLDQLGMTNKWPDLDASKAKVGTERRIEVEDSRNGIENHSRKNRFIDIFVKIPGNGVEYCVAIENKPYSLDGQYQIQDYISYLEKNEKFHDRFLMIYVPPTGTLPSETSISREYLANLRENQFMVLPYHSEGNNEANDTDAAEQTGHQRTDPNWEDFCLGGSLTEWLVVCRERCQVERLRWFLSDAEKFCKKKFGGYFMKTDSEIQTVREFLQSDAEIWKNAQAVYESFPIVKNDVCGRFLKHIRDRIDREIGRELPDLSRDINVDCKYGGEKRYSNRLWLYRTYWKQYHEGSSQVGSRTCIRLESEGPGANNWCIGVRSPLPINDKTIEVDQDSRRLLEKELPRKLGELSFEADKNAWWPRWCYLKNEVRNWDELIPELHREYSSGGGDITNYIVETFVSVAKEVIQIIDEVEGKDNQ